MLISETADTSHRETYARTEPCLGDVGIRVEGKARLPTSNPLDQVNDLINLLLAHG